MWWKRHSLWQRQGTEETYSSFQHVPGGEMGWFYPLLMSLTKKMVMSMTLTLDSRLFREPWATG